MGGPDAGWDMEEADVNPILSGLMVWGVCGGGPVPPQRDSVLSTESRTRGFHVGDSRVVFCLDLEEWGGFEMELQAERPAGGGSANSLQGPGGGA